MKCKMRVIPNLQKECFMHLSPTYPNHSKIETILQKVVPISTFGGGFPLQAADFNDGSGYYFAKDTSGGLIIVDPWKREATGLTAISVSWEIQGLVNLPR